MPLPEDSRQRSDASHPASRIDVCARQMQNYRHCQPTSEIVSIIQVVDTIIKPLFRQLSPISRPMPGGRRRRDTVNLEIYQMFQPNILPWSYDFIAEVYHTDMGKNLPFDDVRFYLSQCRSADGAILELGCGTGRILLPLITAGINVVGIDRSRPMLEQLMRDAQKIAARPLVAQMDARSIGFSRSFHLILAPFSMVTYLVKRTDLSAMFSGCRRALVDKGVLIIDAFVPQNISAFKDYQIDYRRAHGDHFLERRRRITPLDDGSNLIEREYRLYKDVNFTKVWTTKDHIRPYTVEELCVAAVRDGFKPLSTVYDYGQQVEGQPASFATMIFGVGASAA